MSTREKLIQETAKEMGLSVAETRKIVNSQFTHAAEVMRRGEFEAVRLLYLGKFRVKPKRLKAFNDEIVRRNSELYHHGIS